MYLLPVVGDHAIVKPIKDNSLPLFLPIAQAIEEADTVRNTVTIEPLLTTSGKAFARHAASEETSPEKQEEDLTGPFATAVAIEDSIYNLVDNETNLTRLVVIGSSEFLNTGWEGATNLFMNSLNWIFEREESISIRPKSLTLQPLNIATPQLRIYSALALIVIPLGCLIMGLAVWLRRRNL